MDRLTERLAEKIPQREVDAGERLELCAVESPRTRSVVNSRSHSALMRRASCPRRTGANRSLITRWCTRGADGA